MQTGFDGTASQGGVPQVPQLATYTPPQPQTQQQPPMPAGGPMQQAPQMTAQPIPEPTGPAAMAPAQQASAAQMQPAGNDAALVPQIMEVLRNPFISDQDRAFLQQRLDDIQKKQDPMYQMGLEKSQLELEAMRNPFISDQVKPTADIQEYEYAKQQGFKGSFQDFQIEQKRAGASQVNIDQKAEGAFDKKLAEGQAEAFNLMATEGLNARADLGIIGELEASLAQNGGTSAGLASIAAKYGIGGEGMSDIQAANALINKLVPTQRQPGSGSMSDRDVELFKGSLPSLWNAPGGNAKIINVMRGLAAYKQAQGEIADQVMMGEISRQEARKMLRELPNPLARENINPEKSNIERYDADGNRIQ
jgi:flagellar protein FlgJ